MGICWYCHWGWPKPIADIYDEALFKLDDIDCDESPLHYGPAHVVWADENFGHAEWCLEAFDKHKGDHDDDALAIVRWSLEELAKIPLEIRECEPDGHDDMNPQDYPPPDGMEMVKR